MNTPLCAATDCTRKLGPHNRSGYCEACYRETKRPRQIEGTRAIPFTQYSLKGGAGRTTYVRLPREPWA